MTRGARQEEPAAAPRRAPVPAAQLAMAPWLPTKEEKYGVGEWRLNGRRALLGSPAHWRAVGLAGWGTRRQSDAGAPRRWRPCGCGL